MVVATTIANRTFISQPLGRDTATRTTGRRIRGTIAARVRTLKLPCTAAVITSKSLRSTPITIMQLSITVVNMTGAWGMAATVIIMGSC